MVEPPDRVKAEPVRDRECILRHAHAVYAHVQRTAVLPLRTLRAERQRIGSRSALRIRAKAEIGGRKAVLRTDAAIRRVDQAVIDPKRRQPRGVVRLLRRTLLENHCAALLRAVAGIVLHRDCAHGVIFRRKAAALQRQPDSLAARPKQQLDARLSVERQIDMEPLRQRVQRHIRIKKDLLRAQRAVESRFAHKSLL